MEYKLMAVNLVFAGKSPGEVAEELGIRDELVRRRRREYEQYQEGMSR